MTWGNYPSAIQMRDIIKRIATSVVDELRPPDKIGRVVDIDRAAQTAWVVYAGAEDTSIRAKLIPGRQPPSSDSVNGSGNGSIVRVSGSLGSRYITEIMSESPLQQYPRLFNPTIMPGGGFEGTLYSYFALRASVAPPADSSNYYLSVLNFPNWGGQIDVLTEALLSSGKSWISSERFQFGDTSSTGTDLTATMVAQSSTGMDMVTKFNIHDGATDGEPTGTAGLNMSLVRAATSTKTILSVNVLIRCFGSNVKLVDALDGSLP